MNRFGSNCDEPARAPETVWLRDGPEDAGAKRGNDRDSAGDACGPLRCAFVATPRHLRLSRRPLPVVRQPPSLDDMSPVRLLRGERVRGSGLRRRRWSNGEGVPGGRARSAGSPGIGSIGRVGYPEGGASDTVVTEPLRFADADHIITAMWIQLWL